MHIHLPKPMHGWREFLGEVGVIVIGVLIALGAEQAVETLHHRSQVREMTGKLRAESLENRHVVVYDLLELRRATDRIDHDVAALHHCDGRPGADLLPLLRVQLLMPSDIAYSGIRDSALLPLMPDRLVDSYWKVNGTRDGLSGTARVYHDKFDLAAGAVEAVRGGAGDRQVCDQALLELSQLSQTADSLRTVGEFYRAINDQALRGERLDLAGQVLRQHDQPAS